MKKIVSWLSDNLLYVYTLFLLAFIPLYPKLPLLDLKNTWVYIRADDFFIALGVLLLCIQVLRKKATLKTPLTTPIVLFWLLGLISTLFGIVFIFPNLVDAYPNLAILHYLRRIEYLSVFFIAFSAIKTKKQLYGVIVVISLTLLAVVGYGLGQRYLGFHAYLTMNEEFSKGTPLRLSALARIPSTFAGHYDLAAYLVMVIAVTAAMIIGFKNIFLRLFFLFASASGLVLLLMTASRVSFAVYLVTIAFLLVIQKKKLLIIPVIVLSILFASTFEGISERFASTVTQADVIVDARSGKAVGIAKEVTDQKTGKKRLVIEERQSTGEDLPQGSGYINVPNKAKESAEVVYRQGKEEGDLTTLSGDFVVKKVFAYDVSFTTRLQGTWPRALEAFQRNFLLGSGYSSISLASDGNYLRILGEVGSLGFLSFAGIFIIYFIYVYRLLPDITSRVGKHFVLGISAGIFGLALNAVLIDVFEASKVAYLLWAFMGISTAFLWMHKKREVHLLQDLKSVLTSPPAIILYLIIGSIVVFWNSFSNYFVGDDFTWLRWAADCTLTAPHMRGECPMLLQTFSQYFTDAQGFFYRPGTKVYFYLMYALFWLNPVMYHVVSILIHAAIASILYLFGLRTLRSKFFSFIFAAIFLTLSAHFEALFWISVTGHLISIFFVLLGLLLFSYYRSSKNILLLLGSIISMILAPFFHEYAVVGPVLILVLALFGTKDSPLKSLKSWWKVILPYMAIIPVYLYLRIFAESAGFQGDYDYNLLKLPVNWLGNGIGYVLYTFVGVPMLPSYQIIREVLRNNLFLAGILGTGVVLGGVIIGTVVIRKISNETRRLTILSVLLFIISMAPFLGLGNLAERYVYFGSFWLILLFVLFLRFLHTHLKKISAITAYGVIGVIVVVLIGYNIWQLQKINKDWQRASAITKTAVEELGYYAAFYAEELDNTSAVYYLVGAPQKTGLAWVFPIGIEDAVWFTTQNQAVDIHQGATMAEAEEFKLQQPQTRIFYFDENGRLVPIIEESQDVDE